MSGNNRIEVKREMGELKQDKNDDEMYCNKLIDL